MKNKIKKIAKFHKIHENPYIKKCIYNYLMSKISNNNILSKKEIKEIKEYYKFFNIKIKNLRWHSYYSQNNIFDQKYIPESLFYVYILPLLNNRNMLTAYEDKNNLDHLNKIVKLPRIVLKNMNGKNYNGRNEIMSISDKIEIEDGKYLIKPSIENGGGRGIKLLEIKNGVLFIENCQTSLSNIEEEYSKDYLIQEMIESSKTNLGCIYPKSLNTIRIMTYRKESDIKVLSAVARFGNNGNFVDNYTLGGYAVGIELQTGLLKGKGYTRYNGYFYKHSYTERAFKGVEVERFEELKKVVVNLHKEFKYFDLISWDMAIGNDGEIYLIELNPGEQELSFHQLTNGPLFGKNTDEILEKISKRYKNLRI